jgi:hypothetical protein
MMAKKLQRNIDYHAAMAEYYQDMVDEKANKEEDTKKEDKPSDTKPPAQQQQAQQGDKKPTASAKPPQEDPNKILADLHAEVVKQLEPVLKAGVEMPGVLIAQQQAPIRRNESPDLKPSAGRFH